MPASSRTLGLLLSGVLVTGWFPSAAWAQTADAARAPPATRFVHVRIEGTDDAELEANLAGRWTIVCAGSCDAMLPAAADYRIEGPLIRTSPIFHLDGSAGERLTLDVNAGSSSAFNGGVVLVPVGALGILGGLAAVFFGQLATEGGSDPSAPPVPNSALGPGLIVASLGAVAVVVGIVLITRNSGTSVVQRGAGGPVPPASALARLPVWRESSSEATAMPPILGAPVWSTRF
jgi:hypothetical protein